MLKLWRNWRRQRLLEQHAIDDDLWHAAIVAAPAFDRLAADQLCPLRELTTLFLADKRFFGVHNLVVDDAMRVSIASRACLPILHLGLDYYRGWRTIIVYPTGFVAEREEEDEIGVVHTGYEALDGESLYGGAVALNWAEAEPIRDDQPVDVVLHEFAHKLDEANGHANGLPPLPRDMALAAWTAAFTSAYELFQTWVDEGEELPFDDYAATHPAEFFAVATETFFLAPERLQARLPAVYTQLSRLFRQNPAAVQPHCIPITTNTENQKATPQE